MTKKIQEKYVYSIIYMEIYNSKFWLFIYKQVMMVGARIFSRGEGREFPWEGAGEIIIAFFSIIIAFFTQFFF